jgi:hypothetical protein
VNDLTFKTRIYNGGSIITASNRLRSSKHLKRVASQQNKIEKDNSN